MPDGANSLAHTSVISWMRTEWGEQLAMLEKDDDPFKDGKEQACADARSLLRL